MKTSYVIALLSSFLVATVCLAGAGFVINSWDRTKQQDMVRHFHFKFDEDEVVMYEEKDSLFDYRVFDKSLILSSKGEGQDLVYPAAGVSKLRIKTTVGNISIEKSSSRQIKVVAEKIGPDCEVFLLKGDEGHLGLHIRNKASYAQCSGSMLIQVPESLALDVRSETGDIYVASNPESLDAKLSAGTVKIEGDSKDLEIRVATGDISLAGSVQNLDAKIGLGAMDLRLKKIIERGDWELRIGTGDIKVHLPEGQIVEENLKASMGNTVRSNTTGKKSEFKIEGRVGIGNIEVR